MITCFFPRNTRQLITLLLYLYYIFSYLTSLSLLSWLFGFFCLVSFPSSVVLLTRLQLARYSYLSCLCNVVSENLFYSIQLELLWMCYTSNLTFFMLPTDSNKLLWSLRALSASLTSCFSTSCTANDVSAGRTGLLYHFDRIGWGV